MSVPIMSVASALERIHRWAQTHDPEFVALLQPGLSRLEIDAAFVGLPFALAEEVYELYQWRNGQKDGEFQLGLQQSWLYPFMPIEDALKEYAFAQAENYQNELENDDCDFPASGGWLPLLGTERYYAATLGQPPGQTVSLLVQVSREDKTKAWYPSLTAMLEFRADLYNADAMRHEDGNILWWADYQIASIIKREHFPEQTAEAEEQYKQFGLPNSLINARYSQLAAQDASAHVVQRAYYVGQLALSGSELALPVAEEFLREQLGSRDLAASVLQDLLTQPNKVSGKWSDTGYNHIGSLAAHFQIN